MRAHRFGSVATAEAVMITKGQMILNQHCATQGDWKPANLTEKGAMAGRSFAIFSPPPLPPQH